MSSPSFPRITPAVGRLIAVTAVVQLLLATVFTSGHFSAALGFSPVAAFTRPWTFLSYLFVHAGLLHLASNMLGLYLFGAAVEERMGAGRFTLYYLYCGVSAAVFSLALSALHISSTPFVGASGAVLGVAVAFAMLWPQAEILIFPFPIPIKARTLVLGLAALNTAFALWGVNDGVAHLAHLGGLLSGYLYFRAQNISRRAPAAQPREAERVVMLQSASRDSEPHVVTPLRSLHRPGNDPVTAEVDRVLDKISAKGIASLTPEERRFLDEVSRRKQRDLN